MLNPELKLNKDFFSKPTKKSMRAGFGEGLLVAGEKNENIVVLTADLADSTAVLPFAKKYPHRFFDVGVAEQNLVTVAAGFGVSGKIPFVTSYAAFSPGRNWEQIRTTICYNDANVKIVGSHAGLSVGPDGATHQMTEDIALMRVLPNMKIFSPCDTWEAKKVTEIIAGLWGPNYLRLIRPATEVITTDATPFQPGKIEVFWISEKPECAIFATGEMVADALRAADALDAEGVSVLVLNVSSLKPLDTKTLLSAVKKTKCVVVAENHQIAGGLGGVIAETLSRENPLPIEFVGVQDTFGESGVPEEVLEKYSITALAIERAVKKAILRKIK